MNKTRFFLALTALVLGGTSAALAQGSGGPPIPINVPIDAGISLLAVAGAAFGARSLKK